jgi:urease accessory protein
MIMITATIMATTTSMAEADGDALPLYLWLSPAFPVGAFAYSHGLEWAVEAGDVVGVDTLIAWLGDLCDHGAPRNDTVLFCLAYHASAQSDDARLGQVNELAVALAGSLERRLETTQQGAAFVTAARAAWNSAALSALPSENEPIAYPVAVATAAAGRGIALATALPAFALSLFANLVSAAVRLSAIGQTDGQRTLATLLPRVKTMAEAMSGAVLAEIAAGRDGEAALGGAAFRSDIAAMRHETQYSRLFRS